MARIGSQRKSDPYTWQTKTLIHLKWTEFDHIVADMVDAMNKAHYPYVGNNRQLTLHIKMVEERFIDWCVRHYGEK